MAARVNIDELRNEFARLDRRIGSGLEQARTFSATPFQCPVCRGSGCARCGDNGRMSLDNTAALIGEMPEHRLFLERVPVAGGTSETRNPDEGPKPRSVPSSTTSNLRRSATNGDSCGASEDKRRGSEDRNPTSEDNHCHDGDGCRNGDYGHDGHSVGGDGPHRFAGEWLPSKELADILDTSTRRVRRAAERRWRLRGYYVDVRDVTAAEKPTVSPGTRRLYCLCLEKPERNEGASTERTSPAPSKGVGCSDTLANRVDEQHGSLRAAARRFLIAVMPSHARQAFELLETMDGDGGHFADLLREAIKAELRDEAAALFDEYLSGRVTGEREP